MSLDKICVFINSKNRPENEEVSDFNVTIPDTLLKLHDKNEYWNLNVNYFSCIRIGTRTGTIFVFIGIRGFILFRFSHIQYT